MVGEHWPRSNSFPLSSCASRWALSVLSCRAKDVGKQHLFLWNAPAPGADPSNLGPCLVSAEPNLVLPQIDIFVSLGAKRGQTPISHPGRALVCPSGTPDEHLRSPWDQCAFLPYSPCRNGWHLHRATALRRRGRDPPWHGDEALFWHCPSAHGREGKVLVGITFLHAYHDELLALLSAFLVSSACCLMSHRPNSGRWQKGEHSLQHLLKDAHLISLRGVSPGSSWKLS